MENLKQLSVKIDPETLEKVDAIASKGRYWKRNTIINGILTALMIEADERDIYKLIRYWKHGSTGLRITIEEYQRQ